MFAVNYINNIELFLQLSPHEFRRLQHLATKTHRSRTYVLTGKRANMVGKSYFLGIRNNFGYVEFEGNFTHEEAFPLFDNKRAGNMSSLAFRYK